MIHVHQANSGNYEIIIPEGYSVLSVGTTILDGDLYLNGGCSYNPYDFIMEFLPFENLHLGSRTVTSSMLIIRPDAV